MTKPAPKMPADLPPLPMGKNGKPLVYLGESGMFLCVGAKRMYMLCAGSWGLEGDWYGNGDTSRYAAESDSEVCKLNGWGDFAPVEKVEIVNGPVELFTPKFGMMPDKPVEKKTALQIYQESARAALDEAAKECERLASALHDWTVYREDLALAVRMMGREQTSTIHRKAWYEEGRRDQKNHAKVRTVFPLNP